MRLQRAAGEILNQGVQHEYSVVLQYLSTMPS